MKMMGTGILGMIKGCSHFLCRKWRICTAVVAIYAFFSGKLATLLVYNI